MLSGNPKVKFEIVLPVLQGPLLQLEVEGSGFLYRQVRNMVFHNLFGSFFAACIVDDLVHSCSSCLVL